MNLLRPYLNEVLVIPVNYTWAIDVEAFGRWLAKQDKDKRGSSWAQNRRICLIAFADHFGKRIPVIQQTFMKRHYQFKKFPTPIDFQVGDIKIKLVCSGVNERWNIGPLLNSRITENAVSKGSDIYIMACYNVDSVYFMGWMNHKELKQHRDGNHYIMHESKVRPMKTLEILHSSADEVMYR